MYAKGSGTQQHGSFSSSHKTNPRSHPCASFECFVCRRTVALDAQHLTCTATHPTTTTTTPAPSARAKLPLGTLLGTPGGLWRTDEEAEGRHWRHEGEVRLPNTRGKIWQQQHQEQEDVDNAAGKEYDSGDVREEQEAVLQQQLHPAVKGSLVTAAGKYRSLAPSPTTPWKHADYAQLKVKWKRRPSLSSCRSSLDANEPYKKHNTAITTMHTSDVKPTKASIQALMLSFLSPYYVCQYAWLAERDAALYMQQMWCMLHGRYVPAPCASTDLTIQPGDFQQHHLFTALTSEGSPTRSLGTPLGDQESSQRTSYLFPPSAGNNDGPQVSEVEHIVPSYSSTVVPVAPENRMTVSHHHTTFSVCEIPIFNISKIEEMRLHGEGVCYDSSATAASTVNATVTPNTVNYTSVGLNRVKPTAVSSTVSQQEQEHEQEHKMPPTQLVREVFLRSLSRQVMRHVVHRTEIDLPLCLRCWRESLETQQKATKRILEDVYSLAVAHTQLDIVNLVLCYRDRSMQLLEEVYNEGHINNNDHINMNLHRDSTNDDNNNEGIEKTPVYGVAGTGESSFNTPRLSDEGMRSINKTTHMIDVAGQEGLYQPEEEQHRQQQQESLQRLQLEVYEVEARSQILSIHSHVLQQEVATVAASRNACNIALDAARAAYNAQQVSTFFDVVDGSSSVDLRLYSTTCSSVYIVNTRALLLAFPINTSGEIGTIAGLRLGHHIAPPSREHLIPTRVGDVNSAETKQPLTGSVVQPHQSTEASVLLHTIKMQHCYTRSAIGSRSDSVSVAEINNACGLLLLLLQRLLELHGISLPTVVLKPRGAQSTVLAVTIRGSPPKKVFRSSDFFISEKIFAWKTFGAACVTVAACVREIALWMKKELNVLTEISRQRLANVETPNRTTTSLMVIGGLLSTVDVRHWTVCSWPPYDIANDRVDGCSVRHGSVSDEMWTIGMKKLLMVVQWCVRASRDVENLQRVLNAEASPAAVREISTGVGV